MKCILHDFFQIGQHDIPAHRVVLAAASPYWMELFTSEEDQPTRKEVEIDGGMLYELNGGFQKEALERLVEYSYTARLEVEYYILLATLLCILFSKLREKVLR